MHSWGDFGRTGTMTFSYLIYTRKNTDAAKKGWYANGLFSMIKL